MYKFPLCRSSYFPNAFSTSISALSFNFAFFTLSIPTGPFTILELSNPSLDVPDQRISLRKGLVDFGFYCKTILVASLQIRERSDTIPFILWLQSRQNVQFNLNSMRKPQTQGKMRIGNISVRNQCSWNSAFFCLAWTNSGVSLSLWTGFPVSQSNHVGFAPWLLYSNTHHSPEGFSIGNLVELKMLDFGDRTGTCISV